MKNKKLVLLEEIFNSITHGIGAMLSIFGLILLIVMAQDATALKITGYLIFGISLILMYLFSTLYHSLTFTKAKKIFSVLDKSAIFLLIAGTYTPIAVVVLHGWIAVSLLLVIWGLAICGIVFNAVFIDRYKKFFLILYLLMGWICLCFVKPLLSILTLQEVWLLFAGGLFYTCGIIFYIMKKLPFNHTIWHLFVLGGSVAHFLIIYKL